ncbi:peptidylprolyl isomerase [Aneurinibacillus migulanus]|uniref:peptidylprolyl isomerase n=1 Tax=Aneurinibacillus migulanus TaxID=47500 RepID=UPI0006964E2B|nr:peptidylprolyl isomerase [Aneurinibacillus migulanus]CEH28798.1 PPIC-type PPIASE domain protein [Aneurinibacillus migulanus]
MRINKNYGLLALIFVLVLLIIAGQIRPAVAEYGNGEEISESEYKKYIQLVKAIDPATGAALEAGDKDALTYILHFQIMNRYIADQVKETNDIKKEAEKSFSQFETAIKQQLGTGENIDQYYADNNITKDAVKAFFLDQTKMISYFSKDIPDTEKRKEYEEGKKQGFFTQADVRHILINTEERSKEEAKKKAEDLVEQLRAGSDFAKLAKENSDDAGSVETGGLYQYNETQPLGQTVEAYRNAAMTLPLNKISEPVETEYGYHIMRVEKRSEQTYDEVKKQIESSLALNKENEFFTSKLQKIIKKENIPAFMIKKQPQQPTSEQPVPDQTVPDSQS